MAAQSEGYRLCMMQVASLKKKYPDAHAVWKRGSVVWTGQIQPAPICDIYTVQVTWKPEKTRPVVRVLNPELKERPGEPIPHTFPGNKLCLHYLEEWWPQRKIADTVIPWTSLWLFHYEIWLATGQWHGGGHEPSGNGVKSDG